MHEHFLAEAIRMAAENQDGGPFGAVVVKDGRIIASGSNQVTTLLDPTAHAEILAIREACQVLGDFQLNGCTLYTSCEPCPMCLGAIYWSRLTAVYFASSRDDAAAAGFDDSFVYEEINIPPEQRHIPMIRLAVPDAGLPFVAWGNNPDKILY